MIRRVLKKTMSIITALVPFFVGLKSFGQVSGKKIAAYSKPIVIKWVDSVAGNFSFTNDWSYPLGVEKKVDGKAGFADGGFCPDRCYKMLDSNGIVLRDSARIFYQLLDTHTNSIAFIVKHGVMNGPAQIL